MSSDQPEQHPESIDGLLGCNTLGFGPMAGSGDGWTQICIHCQVQWVGQDDSNCWLCEQPGMRRAQMEKLR